MGAKLKKSWKAKDLPTKDLQKIVNRGKALQSLLIDIFSGEIPGFDPMQVINRPSKLARGVRKMAQVEARARGPLKKSRAVVKLEQAIKDKYNEIPFEERMQTDYIRDFLQRPDIKRLRRSIDKVKKRQTLEEVLRGTFFHGRKTFPGEGYIKQPFTFRGARGKALNLGEPLGISLSIDPKVSSRFAKKTLAHPIGKLFEGAYFRIFDRIQNMKFIGMRPEDSPMYRALMAAKNRLNALRSKYPSEDTAIGRVIPLFGDRPRKVTLLADTKRGGKVLKDVYLEAAREIGKNFDKDAVLKATRLRRIRDTLTAHRKKLWNQYDKAYIRAKRQKRPLTDPKVMRIRQKLDAVKMASNKIDRAIETLDVPGDVIEFSRFREYPEFKEMIESTGLHRPFNEALTEALKRRGFKGVLYNPRRYGTELELKVLDPKDVLYMDLRPVPKESLFESRIPSRFYDRLARKKASWDATASSYESLRNWYKEIPGDRLAEAFFGKD